MSQKISGVTDGKWNFVPVEGDKLSPDQQNLVSTGAWFKYTKDENGVVKIAGKKEEKAEPAEEGKGKKNGKH